MTQFSDVMFLSSVGNQKSWYFNLDPSRVRISGYCDKEDAALSLTLPDKSTSLQFTFRKVQYISRSLHVEESQVCLPAENV